MTDAQPPVPGARLLVVDDDVALLRALERTFRQAGYDVTAVANGEQALALMRERVPTLVISDLMMPGMDGIELLREARALDPPPEVLLITGNASVERAVEAMRLGAFDFVEKPIQRDRLLMLVQRALERRVLTRENAQLRERLADREGIERLVGVSAPIVELRRLIEQIASADVPVLVSGESGTGKEVVADLLHAQSPRRSGPLIKISCAAIPETLLERELFGYERGAFSGAAATKRGRFELAHGGTLFLDEIGEMAAPMQAKLLRVLQDGMVQRLGGTKDIAIDVRLVAATNADLEVAMRDGRFRRDLYHRINVIEVAVPPLRTRLEDLSLLVAHFLHLHQGLRTNALEGVSDEALEALAGHDWPGNVRELENTVQRALVTAPGPRLEARDLRFARFASAAPSHAQGHTQGAHEGTFVPAGTPLDAVEDMLISDALRRCQGDKERAAKLLGVSARTLYRRASRTTAAGEQEAVERESGTE